jgi:hypothetical protein
MHFLRFFGFHKSFNIYITKGVVSVTRADVKMIKFQLLYLIFERILHICIGMLSSAQMWIALVTGHAQSRKCQLRIQTRRELIANGLYEVYVLEYRQINKIYQDMHVSNIHHPQLVYTSHYKILDKVGITPKIVVATSCADPFTLLRKTAEALLTNDLATLLCSMVLPSL